MHGRRSSYRLKPIAYHAWRMEKNKTKQNSTDPPVGALRFPISMVTPMEFFGTVLGELLICSVNLTRNVSFPHGSSMKKEMH